MVLFMSKRMIIRRQNGCLHNRDFISYYQNTALHLACLHGKLSTVVALLEHGACVSDINIHSQTPLDMAVDKSRSDVAVLLMEHSR